MQVMQYISAGSVGRAVELVFGRSWDRVPCQVTNFPAISLTGHFNGDEDNWVRVNEYECDSRIKVWLLKNKRGKSILYFGASKKSAQLAQFVELSGQCSEGRGFEPNIRSAQHQVNTLSALSLPGYFSNISSCLSGVMDRWSKSILIFLLPAYIHKNYFFIQKQLLKSAGANMQIISPRKHTVTQIFDRLT